MGGFKSVSGTLSPAERIQRAIEVMKQRGVLDDFCPRCRKFDWNVDLLEIPAKSAMTGTFTWAWSPSPISGPSGVLSVLSIVCNICGYTIFHNLNVLEKEVSRGRT